MDRRLFFVLVLAVLALHGVLFWLDRSPRRPVGDEVRYLARAEIVARGETPPPDLLWPPLYENLLGTIFAWTRGSKLAVIVLQTLLLGGVALLARDLAGRLAGSGPGADLGALLVLLYPPLAAYAHAFWPEVVHLFLLVAMVWILAARRGAYAWLALLGFVLGIALLTKSLLQGFVPALLLAVAAAKPWRQALAQTLLVTSCAAATVAPTVLANFRSEGIPAIADSSRFNLWLGLSDQGRRDRLDTNTGRFWVEFMSSAPTMRERNGLLDERIRAQLASQGLAATLGRQLSRQYFRLFDKDSLLTDQLPGGHLADSGRGYFAAPAWLATLLRWSSWGFHGLLLAAFPLGLAIFPPRRQAWVWLVLAFFAYNALLFLFFFVKSRYLLQLVPFLLLYAAPTMMHLATRPRAVITALPRPRLVAAAAGAPLLLCLAFCGAWLG